MQNRIFLILIGLGIFATLIGLILINITTDYELMDLAKSLSDYGLWSSGIIGLIMLIVNGTFIKTKYFRILKGIFAFILIGTLLKILHWTDYADYILISGMIGIMITYFLSFLNKPLHSRLDYLKLIWVLVSYTIAILTFLHFINREYSDLPVYILWLAIIEFSYNGLKNKTLFREEASR